MRWSFAPPMAALLTSLALAACGAGEAHPYPSAAQAAFNASCPPAEAVCACTWDEITRAMSYEDYEAALERFRAEGLMDPKITRARTACLGKG